MTTYLEFNWHQFDSIFEAMTVVLMISKLNATDFFLMNRKSDPCPN